MPTVNIYSVASELGSISVATRDLLAEAGIENCEIVESALGIRTVRHYPLGKIHSEAAISAAEKALVRSNLKSQLIDAVIYCGIEGDFSEPATANIIADRISLRPKICLDVSNACHGIASGIQVARSLIGNNGINYVMLVTAELSSKVTYKTIEQFKLNKPTKVELDDHIGAFTVGDAGGAIILGPASGTSGIKHIETQVESKHFDLCKYSNHGGNLSFNMDMAKVSAITLRLAKRIIEPAYRALNWTADDVDLFIPHQVGVKPFIKTLELTGITEDKSIATYPELGNLASATIPVCFDLMQKDGRIRPGANMLIGSSGSGIVVTFIGLTL
ncbi:MAG: 3-oxoacyl-[acyl-carrier-protein] synthase III C-terminal domain-containing protein [Pseudohongiellaceae bacterium]